jgi:hypothetical protein
MSEVPFGQLGDVLEPNDQVPADCVLPGRFTPLPGTTQGADGLWLAGYWEYGRADDCIVRGSLAAINKAAPVLGGPEWSLALEGTWRVMVIFGGETCDLLFADRTRPSYVKRMALPRLTHVHQRSTRVLRIESIALTINRFGEPFDKPSHQKVWRPGLGVTVFMSRETWRLQGAPDPEYDRFRRINPTASYEGLCAAAGDAMATVFTDQPTAWKITLQPVRRHTFLRSSSIAFCSTSAATGPTSC